MMYSGDAAATRMEVTTYIVDFGGSVSLFSGAAIRQNRNAKSMQEKSGFG